jgi:hypothetical protein
MLLLLTATIMMIHNVVKAFPVVWPTWNVRPAVTNSARATFPPCTPMHSCGALHMAKDWDAILKQVEEEEAAEENESATNDATSTKSKFQLPIPPDMQYNQRNCLRQQGHYKMIREIADPDLYHDIYAGNPRDTSGVVWFIGKAARVSDVSVVHCIQRQWNLIVKHAINLRPMDLYTAKNEMELWTAPGDSELEVAYNRPDLILQKIDKPNDNEEATAIANIPNIMVGFQGEVYDAGEPGFRTWRLPDGRPARPEVSAAQQAQLEKAAQNLQQPPSSNDDTQEEEYVAPSDEEMEKLQEALKDKDIETLWKEQQIREGKSIDDDEE